MGKSFANREVADLIFVDYTTKKPFMNFDLANTTGYDLDGDSVFAYGGQGHPRRVQFSGNRTGTLRIETQMQTMKLYQLITGANVETSASFIQREVLTPASGKVTIAKTPVEGSVAVYAEADDCGTELTSSVSDKEVTITGAPDGKVVVYYMTALSGVSNLKITAKSFPKAMTVYGETYMKTEDDEIIPYKMIAYKATAQSSMSVDFSNDGDPTSLTITLDLMADKDGNILDLIMEEDEE